MLVLPWLLYCRISPLVNPWLVKIILPVPVLISVFPLKLNVVNAAKSLIVVTGALLSSK